MFFRSRQREQIFLAWALAGCLIAVALVAWRNARLQDDLHRSPGNAIVERSGESEELARRMFGSDLQALERTALQLAASPRLDKAAVPEADAFGMLAEVHRTTGHTIELFDSTGKIQAWAGRSVRPDSAQSLPLSGDVRSAFVTRNGLWTFLSVAVRTSKNNRIVVVSAPLASDLPVTNQYLHRSSLADDLSREIDASVTVRSLADVLTTELEGLQRIMLTDWSGKPLATVFVPAPSAESLAQEYADQSARWTRIFLALAVTLALLLAWRMLGRIRRQDVQTLGRLSVLLGGRYLIVWTGVSSVIPAGSLFDTTVYGSPFGAGIVATPGDTLLTGAALLLSIILLMKWLTPKMRLRTHPSGGSMIRRLVSLAGVFVAAFAIVLFVRGLAATIRSFVFDSTTAYQDATVILPDVPLLLMFVAIVLAGLSFFGVLVILYDVMMSLLERAGVSARKSLAASGGLMVGGAVLALRTIEDTPLWPWYVPLLAYGILWVYIRWESAGEDFPPLPSRPAWKRAVAWLVCACALTAPIFYERVEERERIQVEALSAELLQPVDSWSTYVLTDALRSSSEAFRVRSEEMRAGESIAFELWARTLMSRQGYNSGLVVYDAEGREQDRFVVGIGNFDQTNLLTRLFDHEEETIQTADRTDAREAVKISGLWSSVRNTQGNVLGTIAVFLAADPAPGMNNDEIAPLRASVPGPSLRRVYVTEIRDSLVQATTRPDLYAGFRFRDDVLADAQANRRSWWVEEEAEGHPLLTLFAQDEADPAHVLALSLEELDVRWYAFTVLKLLFTFVVGAGFVLLYRGYHLLRHGRSIALNFGQRLFLAFAVISIVPLIILGYANRSVSRNRVEAGLERSLRRDLDVIEQRIATYITDEDDLARGVTDEFCRAVAAEYDIDFAVYRNSSLLASTRPELYRASLFDRRLEGEAYLESIVRGKGYAFQTQIVGSVPFTVGYTPLWVAGKRAGVVAIPTIYRQREIDEEVAQRNVGVFGIYAIVLVSALAAGSLLASRFAGPVRALSAAARRVGQGQFDVSLEYRGSDEIGELTSAFEEMTKELQQSRAELSRVEREGAWKEMAKQVAHEIRNPLTPMKLSMQHVRQAFRDQAPEREELLQRVTQTVLEQIETLSRIATEFSHFAKMPAPRYERLDVHVLLDEAAAVFTSVQGIEFVRELTRVPAFILADRDQLRRVFVNIFRNSIQAMPHGGTITLHSAVHGTMVLLRLSDNGPGIPADLRTKIFEPNFSTKSEGMGLGLAIASKIVDELGGAIMCDSEVKRGTTFEIRLPLAAAAPE